MAGSGFITIRDTNKQLSCGVLPSSLDHGFIPCAEKMNECLKQQASPNMSAQEQADKLLAEIKKSTEDSPHDKRGHSLYCIDDYDEDDSDHDLGSERGLPMSHQHSSDLQVYTSSSMPSSIKDKNKKKGGIGKLLKVKDALKAKLNR